MKKLKIAIIILIGLALILIGIIFAIRLSSNINTDKKNEISNINTDKKTEISNYIVFESAEYESIENVVFYNKNINIDATLKDNLTIIANELKTKYPNKSILYLRDLGSPSLFNAKELYRCMQIENGQKLDGTDMNILIKENGSIEIQFLIGSYWKSGSNIDNIEITQEQAKQIVIDYLAENPGPYNELKGGNLSFSQNNTQICSIELYEYNSKTSWKMQFSTGDSYIIIDANTGEILDKYFFCGVFVD